MENDSGNATKKVTQSVKDWCAETTAHGVGRVVKEDSGKPLRVTWFVIVVFALAAIGYHLYTVTAVFFAYPTSVSNFGLFGVKLITLTETCVYLRTVARKARLWTTIIRLCITVVLTSSKPLIVHR